MSTYSSTPRRSRVGRIWRSWESPEELQRKPLSPATSLSRKRLFSADSGDFFLSTIKAKVEGAPKYSRVLQTRLLSPSETFLPASCEGVVWLEVTRRDVEVRDKVGPIHSLRLIISSSQIIQLQVTWPVIRTSKLCVLRDSSDVELDNLLQQMLPDSEFAVCPGIADFEERYSADVHRAPQSLRKLTVGEQVLRYESSKCQLWHKTTDQKFTALDRHSKMCSACKALDRTLGREATVSAAVSLEQKIARTHPSSNYPLSQLSPASQKVRVRRLMDERKALNIKLRRFDHLCASLDDGQSDELSAVVQTIEHSQSFRAELDEIFLEADQHSEGHGAIIQDMWEADAADKLKADFMADQQRNSTIMIKHDCV